MSKINYALFHTTSSNLFVPMTCAHTAVETFAMIPVSNCALNRQKSHWPTSPPQKLLFRLCFSGRLKFVSSGTEFCIFSLYIYIYYIILYMDYGLLVVTTLSKCILPIAFSIFHQDHLL